MFISAKKEKKTSLLYFDMKWIISESFSSVILTIILQSQMENNKII